MWCLQGNSGVTSCVCSGCNGYIELGCAQLWEVLESLNKLQLDFELVVKNITGTSFYGTVLREKFGS